MVESFGPPGSVSEAELERVAKSLYDRVEGAPAEQGRFGVGFLRAVQFLLGRA